MPTIFKTHGYRFFFFSLDRGEPIHVHVEKGRKYAKFWLSPLALAKSRNLRSYELYEIRELIEENLTLIQRRWYEHFGRED